ncbi:enoyl-CoA hydratase/isomerase family protein [Pseudoruegeria sp. HB172150]|uniref:enoyl-CoA hydratase/isomerase family protein n=1 Tax=Pseudoruegeria sp. HB172150 TaxID=2721164 RepID=UPI001557A619|nr:enoyl-CoA hydratase/isomerase family protein [Pseudoruegeria sp. HB172150]
MNAQTDARILYEVRDRVAYVTLNRPEAKNAMTKSMYAAIRSACEAADCDAEVDALVVQGSNGAFAVGGDLKEILEVLDGERPTDIFDYEDYLPFEALRSMSKPTVAAIDGLCLGGGLTLALMCDIRIATENSRFAIPEAKVGIVDGHMPRLLRQEIPPAKLRYWMYTGALFPAAEADSVGMLTKVVPQAELGATLDRVLSELKASSLEAIAACKKIINETRTLSPMTDANLSLMKPDVLMRLKAFSAR